MDSRDTNAEVIVIGGGIAGISLAARLAEDRAVCVLEQEDSLAQHTTGKSVATFIQSYGNGVIQRLNAASRPFFTDQTGEGGELLARPLPFLYAARAETVGHLRTIYDAASPHTQGLEFVDGPEAARFAPILRPDWVVGGLIDPGVLDIDVNAVMALFTARLRRAGGVIRTGARAVAADRVGAVWLVRDASGGEHRAPIVVDAAGAWADPVAGLFGAMPRQVTPMRRSVFTLRVPEALADRTLPMINAADEEFYLKPERGQLLCSPADETPTDPTETRPDELEIARALDAMAGATVLDTRYVRTTWAGLRSFAPDRIPVVGFDDSVEGLFWYAAPGGYGIQTCPALSEVGAAILRGDQSSDGAALVAGSDAAATTATATTAATATTSVTAAALSPSRAALRSGLAQ